MSPRLASVGGLVDSIADRNAVACPGFPRTDPNIFCIFGIERDSTDRLHRLLIEDRSIPCSTVVGFPDTAAGRADKKRDLARGLSRSGDG